MNVFGFILYKPPQKPITNTAMVRHRPPFIRPESCPSLEFEFFNTEGNSPDAVVYTESEGILTFKDKHYLMDTTFNSGFPTDINLIRDVFLMENFRGAGEMLFVRYLRNADDNTQSAHCKRTMLPGLKTEEKEKLSAVLNTFGAELAKEAEELNHKIKRIKTLMDAFSKDTAETFPGLRFKEDLGVDVPDSKGLEEMEGEALQLLETANSLAADEPLSKKRKASD